MRLRSSAAAADRLAYWLILALTLPTAVLARRSSAFDRLMSTWMLPLTFLTPMILLLIARNGGEDEVDVLRNMLRITPRRAVSLPRPLLGLVDPDVEHVDVAAGGDRLLANQHRCRR